MSTATENSTAALEAFRAVDFDWAAQLQDVWRDPVCDVPDLHANVRRELAEKLQEMKRAWDKGDSRSPLGWVIVGPGGSGKTHLLGALRREAIRQDAAFVLVDMTDVHDFWDTLLQGYIDSLQVPLEEDRFQYQAVLWRFIRRFGSHEQAARNLQKLATRKSSALAKDVEVLVNALRQKYPQLAMKYKDVVRALICLNSTDGEIASTGYTWLQGQEIDDAGRTALGFQKRSEDPREIVRALSWLMSVGGPSIVAFDQLDPIVHQVAHHRLVDRDEASDEQNTARAIIEQIGGGFGAMPGTTSNTLSIISCVETTWNLLNELVLSTNRDRFEDPIRLRPASNSAMLEALIATRLTSAYSEAGFTAPYRTWPFPVETIGRLSGQTPREVLQFCERHRRACIQSQRVYELTEVGGEPEVTPSPSPAGDRLSKLDERLAALVKEASPAELLDEKHEDERLAPLVHAALQCLIHEHESLLPDEVDSIVDKDFAGGKSTKPLHARLRFIFHREDSREEHYCVRALQRVNARAFQARLKAAMTQSGIDKALKFRHLTIIRTGPPPSGPETQKLVEQFRRAGGRFYEPTEQEIRTLFALCKMLDEKDPDLFGWLAERKPVTSLELREVLVPSPLFGGRTPADAPKASAPEVASGMPANGKAADAADRKIQPPAAEAPPRVETPSQQSAPPREGVPQQSQRPAPRAIGPMELPLGNRILGLEKVGDVVALDVRLLARHTMILGGAGSGKTVTLRRLIEEATLLGIPSIIVDCARDMALFDEDWQGPHPAWRDGDAELAKRFRAASEMIVWTPGRESGNPLTLEPLPDFTPLADDPEELESAVQMVCHALGEIVGPGSSQKSEKKGGLLAASLRYFARQFPGGTLQDYIELLDALPAEAGLGLKQEQKLAEEMADSLKVEIARNPLLRTSGTPLDPAILFGDDRPQRGRARISVISLVGLPSDKMQFYFLNQLAMLLFSWIKKNPTPPGNRALRGLLVIDEAKDYVPSQRSTECKESIMRLAAQARKYGLGLVFATQHPKDIETKIVGNCATHFYGLNNSPASLDTLRDLMQQKGGSGDDIPRLKKGQFYVHNTDAGHQQPIKIKVPISLSLSPQNPLEESQILEKARASRQRLGLG